VVNVVVVVVVVVVVEDVVVVTVVDVVVVAVIGHTGGRQKPSPVKKLSYIGHEHVATRRDGTRSSSKTVSTSSPLHDSYEITPMP